MEIVSKFRQRAKRQVRQMRARQLLGPGAAAQLGAHSTVNVAGGTLVVGKNVVINHRAEVAVFGRLEIGEATTIGDHFHCNATQSVRIGERCQLSWRVTIMDSDFHTMTELDGTAGPMRAAVAIGDHVLIGANVTILKGVTIGDNAIIGAGSVVTRNVRPGVLAAGNPAREIRAVASWR